MIEENFIPIRVLGSPQASALAAAEVMSSTEQRAVTYSGYFAPDIHQFTVLSVNNAHSAACALRCVFDTRVRVLEWANSIVEQRAICGMMVKEVGFADVDLRHFCHVFIATKEIPEGDRSTVERVIDLLANVECPVDDHVEVRTLGVKMVAVVDGDWLMSVRMCPQQTISGLKHAIARKAVRLVEKIAMEENPGDEEALIAYRRCCDPRAIEIFVGDAWFADERLVDTMLLLPGEAFQVRRRLFGEHSIDASEIELLASDFSSAMELST